MKVELEAVCISPKRDHGEIVLVDTNGHGALRLLGSDDEIHELLSLIADLLYENGAEVSKRDAGPEREDINSGNVWEMRPTEEALAKWEPIITNPETDARQVTWKDPVSGNTLSGQWSNGLTMADLLEQSIKDQVREGGRKLGAS